MHITITGNLGSGKSTICKIMENTHGFTIYSTGKVQRELARELGLTTLEMNKLMCNDPKYDTMIDETTARIGREKKEQNIIFDSRLAWNFVEQSFKVFLAVSIDVAATRVMGDNRGQEEQYKTFEEAKALLLERARTEDVRYRDMYGLEYFNYSNYNLVIDSTYSSPEMIAEVIIEEAKKFYELLNNYKGDFKSFSYHKTLLSPRRLLKEEITMEQAENEKQLINPFSYYTQEPILVKKEEEEYVCLGGMEEVKRAALSSIPYVWVTIV